jgi:hypothetical protein
MSAADWPKHFTMLRQLDAVVDRFCEVESYKHPQEDIGFLIDCLDARNRRIWNLLALLERERGLRRG